MSPNLWSDAIVARSKIKQQHRVYSAQRRQSIGPIGAILAICSELSQFRSHIAIIFSAEFASVYRGTLLGVFWNFALPLVPVGVYIMLVNLKVFPSFEGLAPAVYISFNVTLWMLFAGMITRPIQIVKNRTSDVMKTSIPLSAAIASSFAQLLFDTSIRLILVIGLVIYYGPNPNLLGILGILPLFIGSLLFMSFGLILAIFNMIYLDVDRIVSIALQYGIFVSGIIFPISTLGPLTFLEHYNPFNVFVSASRDILFYGMPINSLSLLVWSACAVVVSIIAFRFFYVMEHRIRELV